MDDHKLLDKLDELIFVVDPRSRRLLYANAAARGVMKQPFSGEGRCHQVFYGRESPCGDCPIGERAPSGAQLRIWERGRSFCDCCYILREKPIDWDGTPARLVVACDVTEQEFATRRVRMQLQAERMLTECIRRLTAAGSLEEAMRAVLTGIGEFYGAGRSYILELNGDRTMGSSTYEWRAPGVMPHGSPKPGLSVARFPFWKEAIAEEAPICLADIEQIRESHPEPYEWMKARGIRSIMAAPFLLNNRALGYIGVENPSCNAEDPSLLQSISYFVINELQKRRLHSKLEYQGRHDSLTGFYNRFCYDRYLEKSGARPLSSAGVIFFDINGLKEINDSRGHDAGDAEIRRVAEIMRGCFPHGLPYRIGGDEFIIICEEISREAFFALVEEAKRRFGQQSACYVSTGAVWSEAPFDLCQMCRKADELMYREKERYYSDEERDRRKRR